MTESTFPSDLGGQRPISMALQLCHGQGVKNRCSGIDATLRVKNAGLVVQRYKFHRTSGLFEQTRGFGELCLRRIELQSGVRSSALSVTDVSARDCLRIARVCSVDGSD